MCRPPAAGVPDHKLPGRLIFLDELRDAWRAESRDHRIALLAIGVVALVMRVAYIAQPMRYDESVTYLQFARLPWRQLISDYSAPNNHIFHTLLVKSATTAFGDAPWVVRLPAFLSGVLVVPAAYLVARALHGSRAALVAAAIVASSGQLILFSTNARGYSIVVLAFLLLVLLAVRILRGAASSEWIVFAVIAALGLWTIPVMLYPLGTVCVWFTLSALVEGPRPELRRMVIALALAGVLALLAYSPVLARGGLGAITHNGFVTPSRWLEFFHHLPATLWGVVVSWGLGLHPIVSGLLYTCALVALVRRASISRFRVGLPLAAFVWCSWLLVVGHRAPFVRVWLWLYPLFAALAGAGVVHLLDSSPRTRGFLERRLAAASALLCVALAFSVGASYGVLLSRDTGTYREAKAASVALVPLLRPGDRVVAKTPTGPPLAYYLHRSGASDEYLSLDPQRARRIIVVVDRVEGQTLDGIIAGTMLVDRTRFAPPNILATIGASALVSIERRDVAEK